MPDVNLPIPFEAYSGDEPFIFISYAHKDGAKVFEVITELHKKGYRIWYDEGIDPGNEWPEEIAKALAACDMFVVFMSENAAASVNVRNEINFALNREKPFLTVYLEKAQLPLGLELRMGDLQAILPWNMTLENFWRKLDKSLPNKLHGNPVNDFSDLSYYDLSDLVNKTSPDRQTLSEADGGRKSLLKKKTPRWAWAGGAGGLIVLLVLLSIFMNGGEIGGLAFLSSQTPTLTSTLLPTQTITSTPILAPTATITRTVAPTLTPTLGIGSTRVSEVDGMQLVYVPAGEFEMGTDEGTDLDQKPAHTVYLDAYWIDQTEVTNAMYALCVTEGFCNKPEGDAYEIPFFADHPVVNVTWYDARDYCLWAGRELPTEAQWEKAARGTDGRTYPWGEDLLDCRYAQYADCNAGTKAVGSLPAGASPYGALDMAGNVSEWTADWYGVYYYTESPYINPENTGETAYKVLRGGSFTTGESLMWVTFRNTNQPDSVYTNSDFGFRCLIEEP